ncbi:MAG: hypothetical protein IPH75_13465 [bacterium]|nr:hypothetical protein [bacterium]
MRAAKLSALLGLLVIFAGCSGTDTGDSTQPVSEQDDRAAIQASLSETITRWHHQDKAGLYDNEFDYLKERMTFDAYLETKEMRMDADTVMGIEVKDCIFYGRDSADVAVEILFEGPKKIKSRMRDSFRLYYYKDKWIRPTLSSIDAQFEYDKMKKSYEEAVKAEEEESGDK